VCGVTYEGVVFNAARSTTTVVIFGVDPILGLDAIFCRDLNMIAVRNPMFEKKNPRKTKDKKKTTTKTRVTKTTKTQSNS
jgi:hypothetical protein